MARSRPRRPIANHPNLNTAGSAFERRSSVRSRGGSQLVYGMLIGQIEMVAVRNGGLMRWGRQEDPEGHAPRCRDAELGMALEPLPGGRWLSPIRSSGRKTLLTETIEAIDVPRGFAKRPAPPPE